MNTSYFQYNLDRMTGGQVARTLEFLSRSASARARELGREPSPSGRNAANILLRMSQAQDPTERDMAVEQGARILVDIAADARASLAAQMTQAAAVAAASSSSSSPLSSPPPSPDLEEIHRTANTRLLRMVSRFLLESIGVNVYAVLTREGVLKS